MRPFHPLCSNQLTESTQPNPKYARKDTIHMSERIGSTKVKGVYQIYASRYNQPRGFTEYQLMVPLTQVLHNKGEWYRERDLHRN